MSHAPEPWHVYDRGIGFEVHFGPAPEDGEHWWHASADRPSGECHELNDGFRETMGEANARRIVACVNACAGVETET